MTTIPKDNLSLILESAEAKCGLEWSEFSACDKFGRGETPIEMAWRLTANQGLSAFNRECVAVTYIVAMHEAWIAGRNDLREEMASL